MMTPGIRDLKMSIFTSLLLGLFKDMGGKRRCLDGLIVAVRSETGRNGRIGSPWRKG